MADDGFTAFFQDAYPRVVGQLRLLTGDLASAEDVAQEAFIRAASRWRQLARYDQPEAWVRKTAFRLAIDLLRRARRHRGLLARLGTRREPDAELYPQDRAVIEALLRLPLPLREVLVLHHCLDLPVEAVAAQQRHNASPGCAPCSTGQRIRWSGHLHGAVAIRLWRSSRIRPWRP